MSKLPGFRASYAQAEMLPWCRCTTLTRTTSPPSGHGSCPTTWRVARGRKSQPGKGRKLEYGLRLDSPGGAGIRAGASRHRSMDYPAVDSDYWDYRPREILGKADLYD